MYKHEYYQKPKEVVIRQEPEQATCNFGVPPAATFLTFYPQDNNIIAIGKGYKDVHFKEKIATGEGINDVSVRLMLEWELPLESYKWCLEIRCYGSVKHSDFDLCFEGKVFFATGVDYNQVLLFPLLLSQGRKADWRMLEWALLLESYKWYLDIRCYGTVEHSGFGLCFKRMVLFATGINYNQVLGGRSLKLT
nr:asparagine--tRNA ligase, cytoplasmic 1-like [Tanacetum cinerariifolium]